MYHLMKLPKSQSIPVLYASLQSFNNYNLQKHGKVTDVGADAMDTDLIGSIGRLNIKSIKEVKVPRLDGTGPRGLGPMTGGGRGYCRVSPGARGMGYRRGGVFSRYSGAPVMPYWMAPVAAPTAEQEIDLLKSEAAALKKDLDLIDSRIKHLEEKE